MPATDKPVQPGSPGIAPGTAQQRRDAAPRLVGFLAAGLAAVLAARILASRLVRKSSQPDNPEVAVERRDAPPRLFGFLAAGLAAFLAVSFVVLRLLYPASLSGPRDAPRQATATPELQINPAADLSAQRAAAAKELAGYGWVDRAHGIVRIPIAQAMQDIAKTGIPDWPPDAQKDAK